MPREMVTVQVGQCGNQIGWRFWDLALHEHAKNSRSAMFDEPMSSFFRNVDERDGATIPLADGRGKVRSLRARAVLIDTEEGVVNQVLHGPLGGLFDSHQLITGVSGAGNNWAHGHLEYGPKYRDAILAQLHREVRQCDSPQSFFLLHSLGGGTGSGLGTYILELMEEHFPDLYRFTTAVFPSEDDDVITSPYNSVLAAAQLAKHADCVLPIENQALLDVVQRVDATKGSGSGARASAGAGADAEGISGGGGGRDGGGLSGSIAPERSAGSPSTVVLAGSAVTDSPTTASAHDKRGRPRPRPPASGGDAKGKSGAGESHRRGAAGSSSGRSRAPASGKGRNPSRAQSAASAASDGDAGPAGDGGGGSGGGGASSASASASASAKPAGGTKVKVKDTSTAFDSMNNIAAHLLTNLTSSMRFEGSLNVDLNEITTNLVPYPKLHFLMSSLSPLYSLADVKSALQPRTLDHMFSDAFSRPHQLIRADPRAGTYLACGLLVRGAVAVSDIQRNIDRLRPDLRMIYWNSEGFKVGLCTVPPLGQPYSLLCLANNCCIANSFSSMMTRFNTLYRRRAHVHHYTQYMMDEGMFEEAAETMRGLVREYSDRE